MAHNRQGHGCGPARPNAADRKELLDRPVMGNTPGVHVTLHVIFDCRYPFQLRLETDAFDRLGRHRAIVRKQRMSFAILLASLHPVEPQLITPCHKLFHLHRHQHPPGPTGPYAAMFFLSCRRSRTSPSTPSPAPCRTGVSGQNGRHLPPGWRIAGIYAPDAR